MRSLKWMLLILLITPMVISRTFMLVQLPTYDFEMRVGETMEAFGDAINDPNEPMPYSLVIEVAGPSNATWKYVTDPNKTIDWLVTWEPNEAQIGLHEFIITATDNADTVGSDKSIAVQVHPAKIAPKINVGGCRIVQ